MSDKNETKTPKKKMNIVDDAVDLADKLAESKVDDDRVKSYA